MSGDAALIERMGNAVQAAYKAMEILKEENRQLKLENENLKKQLINQPTKSELVTHQLEEQENEDDEGEEEKRIDDMHFRKQQLPAPVLIPVLNDQVHSNDILPKASSSPSSPVLEERVSIIPKQKSTTIKVASEIGQTIFAFPKFGNAPYAQHFVKHFEHLSNDTVHFMAKTIMGQSSVTICKALVLTIQSYIKECPESDPLINPQRHREDTTKITYSLIPQGILQKLDVLVNMLVSIGSRQEKGLLPFIKLAHTLEKVILGVVRFQLKSPHYAVVKGTLNTARNMSTVLEQQALQSGLATKNESNNDTKSESIINIADNEQAPIMPNITVQISKNNEPPKKKQRKDELAEIFGIASSSDDEYDDNCSAFAIVANSSVKEDKSTGHAVNSDIAVDLDCEGVEIGEDDQSAQSDSDLHNHPCLESEDDETELGDSCLYEMNEENDNDEYAANTAEADEGRLNISTKTRFFETLDLTCRVYVLLSSLIRLRLYDELSKTLHRMAVLNIDNLNEGCVLGVISVFGSSRYCSTLRTERTVLLALQRLVDGWSTMLAIQENINGDKPHCTSRALCYPLPELRILLHRFWSGSICCQDDLPTDKSPLTRICSKESHLIHTEELLSGAITSRDTTGVNAVDSFDWNTLCAFRQLGFWPSISILSGKGHNSQVDPLNCIGLDKVGMQATQWTEILATWDPAMSLTEICQCKITSIASFLKSDSYYASCAQQEAHAALQLANISPLKYVAQEALIEVFSTLWSKCDLLLDGSKRSDLAHALRLLRTLLASVFDTEYQPSEGGWRSGVSGDGFRLESRLDNRVTVGAALLKNIPFGSHFISSALGAALKPTLHWQHLSSCSGRKLCEYAEFVDHCAKEIFQHEQLEKFTTSTTSHAGSTPNELNFGETTVNTLNKLHAVCTEIVSLLALHAIEYTTSIIVNSIRGLLRNMTILSEQSHAQANMRERSGELFCILEEIHKILLTIPAPWGGICHADIQCEIWKCTAALLDARKKFEFSVSQINRLSCITPQEKILRLRFAHKTNRAATVMPVFMISLDKRCDRYRRSLIMLDQANIPVIRVRAWDGTGDISSSAAEMFQRKFKSTDNEAATTSSTVELAELLTSIMEDDYLDIPESSVKLTWDSTLNSMFDSYCKPNQTVIATSSERACAASHLKVWQHIASICGIKVTGSKRGSTTRSFGVSLPSNSMPSPVEIFKTLKHGVSQPKSNTDSNAVAASVRNIYSTLTERVDAITKSDEYFIILEDDVCFPQQSLKNLRNTIDNLMHALPSDVDILYLGGLLPKASSQFKMKHQSKHFFSVNYMWTLQAYVLRRRAVEVLLSKVPICAPVDNFVAGLIYEKELKAYIVKEKLTQKISPSTSFMGSRKDDSDVRPSGRSREYKVRTWTAEVGQQQGKNSSQARSNINNKRNRNSNTTKRKHTA